MSKKTIITVLALVLIVTSLVACTTNGTTVFTAGQSAANTNVSNTTAVSATSTSHAAADSVSQAIAENSTIHEDAADYTLDSTQATTISLNGTAITNLADSSENYLPDGPAYIFADSARMSPMPPFSARVI